MNWTDSKKTPLLAAITILAFFAVAAEEPPDQAWLGVYLADEVDGGIRIVAVVPGGPAAIAGLRSGDLLIEADSVQLADQDALERVLARREAGQELRMAVLRNGEPRKFLLRPTVRAKSRVFPTPAIVPEPPGGVLEPRAWAPLGLLSGLKTVPITAELRRHYGAPADRGVLVVRVDDNGSCGRAGVQVGDVLVGIGSQPVTTPAEVHRALSRRDRSTPLGLDLVRGRRAIRKELSAEPVPAPHPVLSGRRSEESRALNLERTIRSLERQLEVLREQLAELKRDPEASPDR